jgi:CheY-like chemotaxis protein
MSDKAQRKKLKILVVEDNKADADLLCEMVLGRIDCVLDVVQDGEMAVDYLQGSGKYSTETPPDLVLLDLNLPKVSGREVLQRVKQDENLRRTPILVLTSSGAERDILDCYNLNANCYVQKPSDLEELDRLIQNLNSFWVQQVCLPPKKWRNHHE